jgi:hypothetical protein
MAQILAKARNGIHQEITAKWGVSCMFANLRN